MTTPPRTRLWIVPPAEFRYREPFYRGLADRLDAAGVDLTVLAAAPQPSLAARFDTSTGPWTYPVHSRWLRIGRREVTRRSLGPARAAAPPDLVVVEQAIRNLETYPMLLRRGTGLATWGHGRSYSTAQTRPEAAVKQWLTRRADWFFAYTALGAQYVVERGMAADRVTVVDNTIDTDALRRDLDAVSTDQVRAFRERLGLTPGRTALFIGGVDASKGISFLLGAANAAARRLPGFVLLVAGTGAQAGLVEDAARSGAPVRALGRVDGPAKALALAAADVLAVPEWVGLVAVDALVAARPLVTTAHASHSPEMEYLDDGRTAVVTPHDVDAYATALADLLLDGARRKQMAMAAALDAPRYGLENMVGRFADGVLQWRQWRAARERGGRR